MGRPREVLLACVLAGALWFEFGQSLTATELAQHARDAFDNRPARHILILGNSRTFYNAMPDMIRAIADSASDPQKYQIKLEALPGASFESLWARPEMPGLLSQRWDDAILQSESRAQSSDASKASFMTYGAKLIDAVKLTSGSPRLVVNWNYGPEAWSDGDPSGEGRAAYREAIQESTQLLGDRTGARLVDVAKIWTTVITQYPDIVLTSDGNHPTLAGSYLYALALYGDLSHADLGRVTYVPRGLDAATAVTLRRIVENFQPVTNPSS